MTKLCDRVPACLLAALFFAVPAAAQESVQDSVPESAQDSAPEISPRSIPAPPAPLSIPPLEMKRPRVTTVDVDWDAARAALAGLEQLRAPGETAGADAPDVLAQLNAATGKILPKIAASAVPVLLPFDTATVLRDQAENTAAADGKYFFDFNVPTFFYPGPSGYDAEFALQPQDASGRAIFARPVSVQISASTVIYEIDGAPTDAGEPVPQLESQYPGIRRVILENRLRYTFSRFGVPYFVSILCSDGGRRSHWVSCHAADQVAVAFVKALHLSGGAPPTTPQNTTDLRTTNLPEQTSPDFTYYAPGDLLPGTGMAGHGGRADATVYSAIRFPIAHAPAYINSQSFMNWGNCDLTGRVALGGRGKDAAYSCRVNELPLVNDEAKNYAYPWRDNFCEHRHYEVTQCPAGVGHQGEDIRPSTCKLRNAEAGRCEPYQDDVVAVRDGVALRSAGDEALYLVVDAPGEHVRFRYLHMNPHMLDAAGLVSGRALSEGEVLGQVADYEARAGGTSYHLHFNLQVPTRQGWVYVNPYMTLVAAYERLIGGRGRAVSDPPLASSVAPGDIVPSDMMMRANVAEDHAAAKPRRESERSNARKEITIVSAEPCQMRVVKGHRRRVCGIDGAEASRRGKHLVRSVDRRISHKSDRPRHRAGNLRAGHEWTKAQHSGA
jgi:hypothetical protein